MGASLSQPVSPAAPLDTGAPLPPRRKRVPYEKGFSQMDWIRLTQTRADLSGLGGKRPRTDITMEEVKAHNKEDDGWTVLRGKVYNLTPYMKFHPGGVSILRAALGKDCTALFNKYHAWVNAEFMLAKCMVGTLATSSTSGAKTSGALATSNGTTQP